MRTHWLSAAKALPLVTLFLTALFTTSSVRADWGIYQSYIIVQESTYPVVTEQYLVLPSTPAALDGGCSSPLKVTTTLRLRCISCCHPTDTTDADGSLILRSDAY